MIALWIILGLIVLIRLLLLVPLRIFLRFDDELHFKIKYGPILLVDGDAPEKEKPPAPEKKEPKPEKKKSGGAAKFILDFLGLSEISSITNVKSSIRTSGIVGTLHAVCIGIKKLFARIFRLVRKGKFKKFRLSIEVGDEDGGDAALQYGQVCAVAFPLFSYLEKVMRFSEQKVDIRCNYDLEETIVRFEGQLNYRPSYFVSFAMGLFWNYIKNSIKRRTRI